jgi:general secretion pathway protein D
MASSWARGAAAAGLLAVLLLGASAGASGCAASSALRTARAAEAAQDYDQAVVAYTQAVRERPGDRKLRAALQAARLRASEQHFTRGRRLAALGRYQEAVVELQIASELNPANGAIDDALREARTRLRAKIAVTREGKTELQTLIEQAQQAPLPGLELPPDAKLPDALTFRDASTRDVFITLARFAGINVVFDPAFRDAPISIELRGASLEDALTAVAASTRTFYRVTAPRTVTIVPDTPAKRREYEEEVIRTFYLSNADLKETIDLLRIVVDNRRISPITATNALAIKDTPERIAAAARLISAIDKARAEVVIDVELLEVDRTRLKEFGLHLASPGSEGLGGVSGVADVNRDRFTLSDLRNLTQNDVFLADLPALYYRLLKTDTNTRALANPQLRTSEGLPAQARFGERVPVPVTTFAPIATGGVNQQPITSFNYENIGVNIDITPRIHHNDDVSLALKIELSSISGVGFGGLPTFGNRSISATIRLRDGETNMLAGLIRDDERRVIKGIPGLSDIPVLGRIFAATRTETQETDIILVLTPHIVRVLDITEADLRPFRVGRDAGAGAIELPIGPEERKPGPGDIDGGEADPPATPGSTPAADGGGASVSGSGAALAPLPGSPPIVTRPIKPPRPPDRP